MTDLKISPELAEKLEEIARREQRSVEGLLETWVREHQESGIPGRAAAQRQETLLRQDRLRVYERARRYWRGAGDAPRAALTDEQLDELFWVFDHEGIPRLKTEQGTISVAPNPLKKISRAALDSGERSERSDISEHFDEFLDAMVSQEMLRRQTGSDAS